MCACVKKFSKDAPSPSYPFVIDFIQVDGLMWLSFFFFFFFFPPYGAACYREAFVHDQIEMRTERKLEREGEEKEGEEIR